MLNTRQLICAGLLVASATLAAHTNSSSLLTPIDFANFAKTNFWAAQSRHKAHAGEIEMAEFARACFDLGEFATNSSERAELAMQGIAVCRQLIGRNPKSVEGHYFLAMNLGQLARTKGLGALRLVDEMEVAFLRARELDPHLDCGGPERNLGLLYRDAPSIGSVGSRTKARHHLLRAAVLEPQFPENRLNLIESFLKWGDQNGARRELKALEANWSAARAKWVGNSWAASWNDWEKRLQTVKKKIQEPSKAIESPRQK